MNKDRALGLLIDVLADAAFDYSDIDGVTAFEVLKKSGILGCRPATEEDVAESDYDFEVGEDWYFLTDEAKALRKDATAPTPSDGADG